MSKRWHISVLIPARNEQELLPRCLESVLAARSALPRNASCDIVVAVDRSTDRTQALAERWLQGCGTVVSTDAGAVGQARAIAAATALERYRGPRSQCWLANTDADCIVPADWLKKQLWLAQEDIHVIAGTIDVDSFAEHQAGVPEKFRTSYLIRPDGTHPHVHGANLGVRADAYLQAGGWGGLATAEDHDLWNRLMQLNCKRISTSQIRVSTSGRRVGRAPHGFAQALAAHNESAA
jgi:glycosyltransferase involved in cell wall biosynthesis